jgi:hypothetical protein
VFGRDKLLLIFGAWEKQTSVPRAAEKIARFGSSVAGGSGRGRGGDGKRLELGKKEIGKSGHSATRRGRGRLVRQQNPGSVNKIV